jgi:hypothetical protein
VLTTWSPSNTTSLRNGAFLIDASGVRILQLPLLTIENLAAFVRNLLGPETVTKIRLGTYRSANEQLLELLKWLWTGEVHPVLGRLGLLAKRSFETSLPRTCWITSGPMGLMPIHAACDHTFGSQSYTVKYAISSYAVSFRALEYCRKQIRGRLSTAMMGQSEAVAFTVAETPGGREFECQAGA